MKTRTAPTPVLLAGATGLIGRELVQLLLAQAPAARLHALVRRVPQPADEHVHWLRVDFGKLPALPAAQEAYCCLGTTIKQAGSQAAFRAVDFDAVLAFARAARAAGVHALRRRFGAGCRARARPPSTTASRARWKRPWPRWASSSLVIARPSLLAGDRAALGQPLRTGERLALG